jgi:hypothetical protein
MRLIVQTSFWLELSWVACTRLDSFTSMEHRIAGPADGGLGRRGKASPTGINHGFHNFLCLKVTIGVDRFGKADARVNYYRGVQNAGSYQ